MLSSWAQVTLPGIAHVFNVTGTVFKISGNFKKEVEDKSKCRFEFSVSQAPNHSVPQERQQPGHEGCLGSSMGLWSEAPFALQCLLRVDSGASLPGLQSQHWPPTRGEVWDRNSLSVLPFHRL